MIFQKILIRQKNMLEVVNTLEELLDVKFVDRDSSYWGIYYKCSDVNEIHDIRVINNYVDGDWQEENDKDCSIIIELNEVQDEERVLDKIVQKFRECVGVVLIYDIQREYSKQYLYQKGKKILRNVKRISKK